MARSRAAPVIYDKDDGSGHTLPLTIASDADLDPPGFDRFVNFSGGVLKLTGPWSSNRSVSIVNNRATIDTNGFDAAVMGAAHRSRRTLSAA